MAKLWRVLTPQQLDEKAMRFELLNALGRMGTKVKRDYQKTVETWDEKPKFEVHESLKGGKPNIIVDTDSAIYRYVDKGTEPHGITPKNSNRLKFKDVYTAKTVPDVIGSNQGGPSGDEVYTYQVWHPGFEARNFSKRIAEKWRKDFRVEMDAAMIKVRLKSRNPMP